MSWVIANDSTSLDVAVQRIPRWPERYANTTQPTAAGYLVLGDSLRQPEPLVVYLLVDEADLCSAAAYVEGILDITSGDSRLEYTGATGGTLTYHVHGWARYEYTPSAWDTGRGVLRLELLPSQAEDVRA